MKHFSRSDNYTGREPDASGGRVKLSRLKHQLPPPTLKAYVNQGEREELMFAWGGRGHVTLTSPHSLCQGGPASSGVSVVETCLRGWMQITCSPPTPNQLSSGWGGPRTHPEPELQTCPVLLPFSDQSLIGLTQISTIYQSGFFH